MKHTTGAGGSTPRVFPTADVAAAATIVLLVIALGLAPHARLSASVGDLVFFKNAYDEDTYFLFMRRGIFEPYRALSHYVLAALYQSTGRSADLTLIAADVILPALTAVAAYFLAGRICQRWQARALLALALMFGQEFLSLANGAVWSGGSLSIELFRSAFGAWGSTLVPSPEVSYLTLFRTPEPQFGYAIIFAAIGLLVMIAMREETSRETMLLAGLSFCLPFTYVFISLPTLLIEAWLAAVLVMTGRRRAAARLAVIVLGAAAVFGLVILMTELGQVERFSSRLPIVTPGILLSALLMIPLAAAIRRWRPSDPSAWLGVGFLAIPIILGNQQVVTGVMVSARDWERNINYQFLLLGLVLIARSFFPSGPKKEGRALAFTSLAAACGLAFALAIAQAQSFRYWVHANLTSIAMARALRAVRPPLEDQARILLDDPGLAPLVAVRTGDRFTFVLDYTRVFLLDTPRMDETGHPPRRPHEGALFEHWWRTGIGLGEAEKLLAVEAAQRDGYFLGFLFSVRDYWPPDSDNRAVREADIIRNIPEIIRRYEAYLARPPAAQDRIVFLSSRDPATLTAPPGLKNTPLSTGRAADTIIYAYRQERF